MRNAGSNKRGMGDPLSTTCNPLENPRFDQSYKQLVDADIEAIKNLCKEECCSPMEPVTESEVATALKRLNNNKAVDIRGLTSEHFKIAGKEIIEFLVCLLDYIIASKSISIVLKEGILTPLTPIFKKGDPTNPGN